MESLTVQALQFLKIFFKNGKKDLTCHIVAVYAVFTPVKCFIQNLNASPQVGGSYPREPPFFSIDKQTPIF